MATPQVACLRRLTCVTLSDGSRNFASKHIQRPAVKEVAHRRRTPPQIALHPHMDTASFVPSRSSMQICSEHVAANRLHPVVGVALGLEQNRKQTAAQAKKADARAIGELSALEKMLAELEAETNPHEQCKPGDFLATHEWQTVPQDAICPPGLQFKIDLSTGLRLARLPPPSSAVVE
eukprot:TRINITY_DN44822_c0_g1_i1.p1 TRINITY_DN44822_c0_g1~~TRINITY_DN44822_c0_g1_i1.p1  ORF type:complete len:194 (-),score=41.42 TRINITY_DN44822_c0_g1_i1:61-594(-)